MCIMHKNFLMVFAAVLTCGFFMGAALLPKMDTVSDDKYIEQLEKANRELESELKYEKWRSGFLLERYNLLLEKNNGGRTMSTSDNYDISNEYAKKFRQINAKDVPESETYNSLMAKMKESLEDGYDLLPGYYGWSSPLDNRFTKEFETLNNLYKESLSNQDLPIYDIYGTFQELSDIVNESVKQKKNLLGDYYGWSKLGELKRIESEFAAEFAEVARLYRAYFNENEMVGSSGRTGEDIVNICNQKLTEKKGLIPDDKWQELADKVRRMSDLLEEYNKVNPDKK